uniref:Uncharacterized protein n=1 Tax=Panagrolaimus superbus TaxID=310955 RepID=A0A914YZB8_9BILA
MPFNLKSFDAAIDIYNEAGHDDSVNNNDSLISFGHFTTNENIATENDDDNEPYSDVGSVLDIFDLDSSKLEDNTSSHNGTIKKFPSTIKEMEDNFDESSDKISLFDTLNSLKKDKGWEGKVQEFAKKSINDNVSLLP